MNNLIEICNSTYDHAKLESFGKKYYLQRFGDKILCEECKDAFIDEASKELSFHMIEIVKSLNVLAEDSISFTYDQKINCDYMLYILPIKFKIIIEMGSLHSNLYDETINNCIITITPNCPAVEYPTFKIVLNIPEDNYEEYISSHIKEYLISFINSFFVLLPDNAVQTLMNAKANGKYSSSGSSDNKKCSNCYLTTDNEYYIYSNQIYCLDCMYGIVVKLCEKNNITDDVGLSIEKYYTTYTIVDTPEWKRSVIDKYINKMKELGVSSGIIYVRISIQ